jgi:hypothetical protein
LTTVTATSTSFSDNGAQPGAHYAYTVAAVNPAGISARSGAVMATASKPVESPYGGRPWPIPGKIQAADFDNGGENVAYHVASTVNRGGAARLDDAVSVEGCGDQGSKYDISYSEAGERLKYTVDIAEAGEYEVQFRVADGYGRPGSLHLQDESGANLSGPVNVAAGANWQGWTTVTARVKLPAGKHILTVVYDRGGFNFASMTFTAITG